jgi:hypothetical protein
MHDQQEAAGKKIAIILLGGIARKVGFIVGCRDSWLTAATGGLNSSSPLRYTTVPLPCYYYLP